MSASWSKVPLGDVITLRNEFIIIDDLQSYKRPRVQLHAQGIVLRDQVLGALIKTKKQQVCRSGEFLVAEIDAKVGGFGIVPTELNGAIVSSHYFLFTIKDEKLDRSFLDWYIKTPAFWEQVTAQGSTNYAAIRPADVLNYLIPLPPLVEQRRIVNRIEELSVKVIEVRSLREHANKETEALLLSALREIFLYKSEGWRHLQLDQAIVIDAKQVDPSLPEFCTLPHISGENIESNTCRLLPWRSAEADGIHSGNYLFNPGSVLYSKIRPYLRKAVYVHFQGVCSADIYPIRVINDNVDPQFIKWTLVAEPFTEYANSLSGRTRMPKLNRKQLFGFPFAYPSLSKQRRIVAFLNHLQTQVEVVKELHVETAAVIDAMLPTILDRAFKREL